MKRIILIHFFLMVIAVRIFAQQRASGWVVNHDTGEPVAGATVLHNGRTTVTDTHGGFTMRDVSAGDTLVVRHIAYDYQAIVIDGETRKEVTVRLYPKSDLLQEVQVNTGYQSIPRERATGSFTHINQRQLDNVITTNLLDRIEGIANGVNFTRDNIVNENASNQSPKIRVRGVSTIESSEEPLLIVDNFPYESDITTINPNDVESITILRDAAAASIWGARAGNGVIVITTKRAVTTSMPGYRSPPI